MSSVSVGRLIRFGHCYTLLVQHERLFYDWKTRSDTIFALSTSIAANKGSPLGVVRVSGPKTPKVLSDIIRREPLLGNPATVPSQAHAIRPRHATLSKIFDPRNGELVDMGLALWFPRPNSYTGEDSCEFHLHGSQAIIKRVLTILGDIDGLRPAEPGEFTRRAVENGKLDLIQAESLPELISAQTDQQRKLALQGLVGSTRARYESWAQSLTRILAHLEASIDFGEDELIGEQRVVSECIQQLAKLTANVTDFIALASRCRDIVRSGVRVSILGAPNAGKSTLMNILCRREKSIVCDLSGTTRDVIEHTFDLGGHTLELRDTAGLRDSTESCDPVERKGIQRAFAAAVEADLIIYLIDASRVSSIGASVIFAKLKQVLSSVDPDEKKIVHVAINKMDLALAPASELEALTSLLEGQNFIFTLMSCRTNEKIQELVDRLIESLNEFRAGELGDSADEKPLEYVNERHLALLRSTARHLKRAQTMDMSTIDEMAQHVRESVDYLSRIVGAVDSEDIFDVIFRDFCIGK